MCPTQQQQGAREGAANSTRVAARPLTPCNVRVCVCGGRGGQKTGNKHNRTAAAAPTQNARAHLGDSRIQPRSKDSGLLLLALDWVLAQRGFKAMMRNRQGVRGFWGVGLMPLAASWWARHRSEAMDGMGRGHRISKLFCS